MDIPIISMTHEPIQQNTQRLPSEQRHPCLQELRVATKFCKMRLRIKTFDGRLERVSVEDNSTLGDLQKQVAGVFPTLGPGEVKLSLNKKVSARAECIQVDLLIYVVCLVLDSFYTVYQLELDGAAQDLLRTAGICGGDTLWILSSVPDEKESSQSDRHYHTASASKVLQSSQQSSQAAEQQSSLAAEQQTPQQASARIQEMQEAHKPDMQQLEQVHPVSVILFVWNKTNRHMTFILICFSQTPLASSADT